MRKVRFFVALVFTVSSLSVMAFDDFDPDHNDPWAPGDPSQPPLDIPIDGGALALLAGGAALGYKALKKKKEDNLEK